MLRALPDNIAKQCRHRTSVTLAASLEANRQNGSLSYSNGHSESLALSLGREHDSV
jgi:hypothetical protein